jgi:hypothetical protein
MNGAVVVVTSFVRARLRGYASVNMPNLAVRAAWCSCIALLWGCGSSGSKGATTAPIDGAVSSDTGVGSSPDDGSSAAPAPDASSSGGGTSEGGTAEGGSLDGGSGEASAGPTVGGCPMFPPSYPYNVDISGAPLDPGSATYISNLTARAGAIVAEYPGDEYVNVVPASQAFVAVGTTAAYGFDTNDTFFQNGGADASAPIPSGVLYENATTPNSDHHMMIVQQGSCRLFELYAWNPTSATTGWEGFVTWNLTKNEQLPDGWGSTTAAGTPLLPGVIWYDEVAAGAILHAVDIVIPGAAIAQYEYVKPAARSGGACGSAYPADGFPYGGRVRLKASYDASSFTGTQALVVVAALKKYGMLNTDDSGETRSSFRLGDGNKLDQTDMAQLGKLTWADFEVPTMTVVQSKACN